MIHTQRKPKWVKIGSRIDEKIILSVGAGLIDGFIPTILSAYHFCRRADYYALFCNPK